MQHSNALSPLPGRPVSRLAACLAVLALGACSSVPERYHGPVRVLSEEAVAGCVLLDEIETSSGLVGLLGPKGVDNNRQVLLSRAERMDGTHVVWGKPLVGDRSTSLSARVYRCPDAR
ncbi:hypothetical protein [uncultured Aquabacterium sp.]|uniref:hypothetical protein n=1 Tax=uncultured Aquabacterium sp. TaxID=158753 RepID=UPI0025DC5A95|nr:hypothetical protein [uncultured Aquabacterium sp.]